MVANQHSTDGNVKHVSTPDVGDVIIDIRHPSEAKNQPLISTVNQVLEIPFYRLASESKSLNINQHYLIYCDKGIMSRLQALNLKDQGFQTVSVLVNRTSEPV
jgi:thiamine biosynthesis protein ThiI